MLLQSLAIRMLANSQATLPASPADGADHRGPIIVIGAVPTPLIGATPRRSCWIGVLFAFFPPRSETSRQSQSRRLRAPLPSAAHEHSVGVSSASGARSSATAQVPQLRRSLARPCRHHAPRARLGAAQGGCQRRWCPCRDCSCSDTSGIGNRHRRACGCETVALAGWWHHSPDSVVSLGGNISPPTRYFLGHPADQLSGRSFPKSNMHKLVT